MAFYETHVDIAIKGDWEDILVVGYIVKADNPDDGQIVAYNAAKEDYPKCDYYVWSIDPSDEITDELEAWEYRV